jgi:DNA-binding IclR family transcriptional regulator
MRYVDSSNDTGQEVVPVQSIQAVQRALTVLEAIAELQPVSLATLYRKVQFDKSTTQRLLTTLDEAGWIQTRSDDPNKWELSLHALVVVTRAQGGSSLLDRARPVMSGLRDVTGETVVLAVPNQGTIVAIEVFESEQLVRTSPRVGMRLPADSGGAGLAILAHLSPNEVGQFVEDAEDEGLARRLEETRDRGWSLSSGPHRQRATSIGKVLLDSNGRPGAALVVTGPSDRLTPKRFEEIGVLLTAAAGSLTLVGLSG